MLVTYATKHGATEEVAGAVAEVLRTAGYVVDLRPVSRVGDLSDHDAVILGAPIYVGRWHKDARRFLERHRHELESKRVAVFALGPLTARAEKPEDYDTARQQLQRALDGVQEVWPRAVEVFGGALEPGELHFPLSRMPAADVRDWDAIRVWASGLPSLLGLEQPKAVAV